MRRSPRLALALLMAAAPLTAQERVNDAAAADTKPMPAAAPAYLRADSAFPLSRELASHCATEPAKNETQVVCQIQFVRVSEQMVAALRFQSSPSAQTPRVIRGVNTSGIEQVGVNFEATPVSPDETRRVQFLSNKELKALMEKLQQDASTNVMSAPKVTMLAGEPAKIQILERRHFVTDVRLENDGTRKVVVPRLEMVDLGTKMTLAAIPSADGRSVKVTADVLVRELGDQTVPLKPVTLNLTARMPDGSPAGPVAFTQYVEQPRVISREVKDTLTIPTDHSVILHAGASLREVRQEHTPPMLSKLPYLNRLFKNVGVGREPEHLLVILTPTVLRTEETCPAKCPAASAPVKLTGDNQLKLLMKAYEAACADGETNDARRLAIECLAIDPTCFGKK